MKTKILLTNDEYQAFLDTRWTEKVEKCVQNDPDWGFTGSNDHWVVYFNYEMSPTYLIEVGKDIQFNLTEL